MGEIVCVGCKMAKVDGWRLISSDAAAQFGAPEDDQPKWICDPCYRGEGFADPDPHYVRSALPYSNDELRFLAEGRVPCNADRVMASLYEKDVALRAAMTALGQLTSPSAYATRLRRDALDKGWRALKGS